MAKKRWSGEFLVEVREDGSVLMPIFDFDQARPTHYRVKPYGSTNGELLLTPMKVATEEDLHPPEPEPPKPEFVQRPYTDDEKLSLSFACPFCEVPESHACIARPSGKMLIDYQANPEKPLVHSKRLALAREHRQMERTE